MDSLQKIELYNRISKRIYESLAFSLIEEEKVDTEDLDKILCLSWVRFLFEIVVHEKESLEELKENLHKNLECAIDFIDAKRKKNGNI